MTVGVTRSQLLTTRVGWPERSGPEASYGRRPGISLQSTFNFNGDIARGDFE